MEGCANKKRLTHPLFCGIVDGRMEEHRSFFCAQKSGLTGKAGKRPQINTKNGGGSRAHKNYTGMYGVQAAELQHDEG